MKKNKGLWLLVALFAILGFSQSAEAAGTGLKIQTIAGTVYQDINQNGVLDISNLERGVSQQTVTLYETLENAKAEVNPLSETRSNSLGGYSFSKLGKGTYYVRYGKDSVYQTLPSPLSAIDADGTQLTEIAEVKAGTKAFVYLTTANLPVKKTASLLITPFEDLNWNGTMDADEPLLNGKTMMIINLRRLSEAMQNGELDELDTTKLISSALSGQVDISDYIYLRTTKNNQIINMPDVSSDVYIIMRSPFNLTTKELLGNIKKITAILNIIKGSDVQALLDDPELIATGDIDTQTNEYIQLLASIIPKVVNEAEKIDYDQILDEDTVGMITNGLNQMRSIGRLLENIPALRIASVNHYGTVFDLTGFKVKKTNEFHFGIMPYGVLSGQVFNDTNFNGVRDTGEGLRTANLTAYDENGTVLGSVKASAYSGYKIEKLPYGQTIYLGIDVPEAVFGEITEKPASLADKKIVAVYNFEKAPGMTTIQKDVGVKVN